ncbi:hypothetical protein [Miltoncostaea marina]|uniref:hypothetical protein n=1 Tax=Miltoncostaea marina TaxID=2843215 RepID=UPI001C3CA577|nr:hypothetical protein [Miltoncostaea marina]
MESVTGRISLLWEEDHPYLGPVLLIHLEGEGTPGADTFEVAGELAGRLRGGALAEGMRVRVDHRRETVESVNLETGETSDDDRPVVVDVIVLDR